MGATLGLIVGAVAMFFVAYGSTDPIGAGPVILDSGGTIYRMGGYTGQSGGGKGDREDISEQLPLTEASTLDLAV